MGPKQIVQATCSTVTIQQENAATGLEGSSTAVTVTGNNFVQVFSIPFSRYNGTTAIWSGTITGLGKGQYTFSGPDIATPVTVSMECVQSFPPATTQAANNGAPATSPASGAPVSSAPATTAGNSAPATSAPVGNAPTAVAGAEQGPAGENSPTTGANSAGNAPEAVAGAETGPQAVAGVESMPSTGEGAQTPSSGDISLALILATGIAILSGFAFLVLLAKKEQV